MTPGTEAAPGVITKGEHQCQRRVCPRRGFQKEKPMKRYVLSTATALAIAFGAQAVAQSVTVEIAPEQRTRIKEYVVKEKVRPSVMKERVTVGATLPADVELQSVPSDWGPSVTKYRYVYHDNHVVLVEPSSRRVVQIID
jgi:hypothetical protein